MAVIDGPAHLLSLKVMRVSRPEVASAWQPFFSSSPFFSAHSSAAVLSLQGNKPLPGHPKTLRDLTHASDLVTLPSSFGSIQLGQTFSSCLCINNEAPFSVDSIHIRVEMQTATSKLPLFRTQEPTGRILPPGDTLESLVSHEIKELGQHVLACTVTYRLPPNVRPIPGAGEDPNDPGLQTFRKFYKFIVTNPLAVKTKVHPVRSPTAFLTPSEREKIFLEVHIQNVTQETMHFERMSFEPTDEWQVQDSNFFGAEEESDPKPIFSDSLALMNPQDVRQYIFILSPISASVLRPLAVHPPGSIFPLGRLNIVWRSSYGEPGRLLTSMLTRRIPLVNPGIPASNAAQQSQQQQQQPHPVSAVPPYLKRGPTSVSSRPQSPTTSTAPQVQSRPSTPPPYRPQSPVPQLQQQHSPTPNIDAHLTFRDPISSTVRVEVPFTLGFTLHIAVATPTFAGRRLLFAVQHVLPLPPPSFSSTTSDLPRLSTVTTSSKGGAAGTGAGYSTPRTTLSPISITQTNTQSQVQPRSRSQSHSQPQAPEFASPRTSLSVLSSGFSTPTAASSHSAPTQGTFNYSLARQKLLDASPRVIVDFYGGIGAEGEDGEDSGDAVIYPPPYPLNTAPPSPSGTETGAVVPLGASSFPLPPLTLVSRVIPPHPSSAPSTSTTVPASSSSSSAESTESQTQGDASRTHWYASYDFDLTYLPLHSGLSTVGGVRILYLGEDAVDESEVHTVSTGGLVVDSVQGKKGHKRKAQIVKEYDVVAEIWVS